MWALAYLEKRTNDYTFFCSLSGVPSGGSVFVRERGAWLQHISASKSDGIFVEYLFCPFSITDINLYALGTIRFVCSVGARLCGSFK